MLHLIGRKTELFTTDINRVERELQEIISKSKFLVLGAAGSIGQAVTKEIFKRNPKKLHAVDISENNLVELVRDIRSSFGYIDGEFKTFALDIGSYIFDAFYQADGEYDYVLNLSALKHVRSEKDAYTLMRMIDVNVFYTDKTIGQAIQSGASKYFCVSTDKAANPVNLMGGSKRIMEMYLMQRSQQINISTARFANVAFSDGSLLHGFNQRMMKNQPIVAPSDVRRYFVTPKESGELCLMSCIFGENRDIFFPKLNENLHLISFADIAVKYLNDKGLEPFLCETEEEARQIAKNPEKGKWPCFFAESNTTGEKDFEEFFTDAEILDMQRFENLGVIKNNLVLNDERVLHFTDEINKLKTIGKWDKETLVALFNKTIPNLNHQEKGFYLDSKM